MRSTKLSFNSFIEMCKIKHGDRYIYDKVIYTGSNEKVIITCRIHGDFNQRAYHHKNGKGCPVCGDTIRRDTSYFIDKSRIIHGEKYDYSKLNYINNNTKVNIICKIHGEFQQNPTSHLKGFGCSKCSGCSKLDTEDFVKRSITIHGNKYDYSKVNYKNSKDKIIIVCKSHGDFLQSPSKHLMLQGCPKCDCSKGESMIERLLKENLIIYKSQYSFEDLKFKKNLRFDFAIFDSKKNLKFLIEFNGQQHYIFKSNFHKNEKDFSDQKNRDNLKIEYCKNNNIQLHIIKYDEDIKEKLNKIISSHQL